MPRRPAPWWRPLVLDALIALLLFGTSAPSWLRHAERAPAPAVIFLLALVMCAALVLRRRAPEVVFAVVAGAAFMQWLIVGSLRAFDLAVLIALYAVSAYADQRWALAALGVTLVGAGLAWETAYRTRHTSLFGLLPPAAVAVAIWLVGRNLRTRRLYLTELEERAVRLERERGAMARAAVAEERARIAREMHDVVAHTVAVMVAQAEGASAALRRQPEQAEAALTVITEAGRSALAELRRMLGVLKAEGDVPGTTPQPGVDDIDSLVDSMRRSGLPIRLVREGPDPIPMEPTLALTMYRIVQESLTNTLKHSGPDTPTRVTVRHQAHAVEIEVLDSGTGRPVEPAGRGPAPAASAAGARAELDGNGTGPSAPPVSGHGLSGMRERVALFAGQLSAGPTPTGGWRVHAVLPTAGGTS